MELLREHLINVPILDIGNKVGHTEYIDFIPWDTVTSPVMKGTDIFGRKFFVIKMIINDNKIMQTFFQRYSNGKLWMGCGHATMNLIDTCGGMSNEQFELIANIIKFGKAEINENHRPVLETFINNTVELYKFSQEC